MTIYHPWTTDNRWGPGNSGASAPDTAPAAYAARWIDQGDHTPADVVPDRQGFAYSDPADRDALIALMGKAGDDVRTPYDLDRADGIRQTFFGGWFIQLRRAGGYIYVDAWLTPAIDPLADSPQSATVEPPAEDMPTWGLTYGEAFTDPDSGTTYTPFIGRNGQAGHRCDHTDGRQTFIYLNPSGGSDDGVATVFVYQDEDPDLFVGAMIHFDVWEGLSSVAD